MGSDQALFYMSQMVMTAMLVAGPLLVVTLVVGLLISVFQVATQIQEMTLSYVPKLLAAALVLILLGSWMLGRIVQFAQGLYQNIPNFGGQ